MNIQKSSIKVLWLDTNCIWKLNIATWQKIAGLVLKKKIIVVDTGQEAEMQERYSKGFRMNDDAKKKLKFYNTIVEPFFSIDHSTYLARQTKIAMEAYARNVKATFSFMDLFDPFLRQFQPLLNLLNEIRGDKWGTARAFKKISNDIVNDWRAIREQARQNKEKFAIRQKKELLGVHSLISEAANGSNDIRKKRTSYSYLKKWQRITGKSDFTSMLDFFRSDFYFSIPYIDVHSRLISDLIVGTETPKDSDYFDIVMIAMVLPFADIMVVDKAMKNRILKLGLIKPKGIFSCKIIKQSELNYELAIFLKGMNKIP